MTLGEFIRKRREELDISLREFAGKLDITATFQSDIERNRRYPSDEILARTAVELSVSLEELKRLDNRVPVKELKELFDTDQDYGYAFRKVAENRISPNELLEFIKKRNEDESGSQ